MVNLFFLLFCRDFITDCFKPSPRRPYEIPWEQKTLWAFLFGGMLLIAIIGNCIVIWIVLGMQYSYILYEQMPNEHLQKIHENSWLCFSVVVLIRNCKEINRFNYHDQTTFILEHLFERLLFTLARVDRFFRISAFPSDNSDFLSRQHFLIVFSNNFEWLEWIKNNSKKMAPKQWHGIHWIP